MNAYDSKWDIWNFLFEIFIKCVIFGKYPFFTFYLMSKLYLKKKKKKKKKKKGGKIKNVITFNETRIIYV